MSHMLGMGHRPGQTQPLPIARFWVEQGGWTLAYILQNIDSNDKKYYEIDVWVLGGPATGSPNDLGGVSGRVSLAQKRKEGGAGLGYEVRGMEMKLAVSRSWKHALWLAGRRK